MGAARLEMLRAESFDIVLLDVVMPEIDGFEVLAQMQADGELRHIPVIMISALEDIESVVRAIELGADDFAEALQPRAPSGPDQRLFDEEAA